MTKPEEYKINLRSIRHGKPHSPAPPLSMFILRGGRGEARGGREQDTN